MKRIKEPPPEFFRFQKWYNFFTDKLERCCVCERSIRKGIHDLKLDLIYCFDHADEDGPKRRIYADYEIEAAEDFRDGQSGFICPKEGGGK